MKRERSLDWWMGQRDPVTGVQGVPPGMDLNGDPYYAEDPTEIAPAVTKIVETPPVKPGMGLVRD